MATSGASLAPIYERLAQSGGYHPGSSKVFTDWATQGGDIVTMSREGTEYTVPVFSTTMRWNGSPITTIEASGKKNTGSITAMAKQKYSRGGGGYRNTTNYNSRFVQEENMIGLETNERISAINGVNARIDVFEGSGLWVNRDNITGVTGQFYKDENGKVHIIEGSGLYMDRSNASFGLYDEGNLTGGIVVEKINDGTTTTKIKGTRIVIGDDPSTDEDLPDWIDTTEGLIAQKATIVSLNAVKARVSTLEADSITAATLDANIAGLNVIHVKSIQAASGTTNANLSLHSVSAMNNLYVGTGQSSIELIGNGLTDSITDLQVVLSGNTYTLQKKTISSHSTWTDVGNFSRATSLSGAWSGGTVTVTASPQGNTWTSSLADHLINGSWTNTTTYTGNVAYVSGESYISTGRSITVDATSAYTAGRNVVSIGNPTWSNATGSSIQTNSNTATFSTDAPTPKTKTLPLYVYLADSWSGNTRTVYMSHTDTSTEANRIAKINVDASARYTAGQNAVSIGTPTWSNTTGSSVSSNSNTATFSTDAPTPKTRSLALYTTLSDSWSGNVRTVYVSHTDSTASNRIAKIDVDASARYTAGQNSVSVSKGSWSGGICSLTTSAGTGAGATVQLTAASATWSSNTASVKIWDGTAPDSSHGVDTGYTVTVDASARYTAGRNVVSINAPTWSSTTGSGVSSNSNTATFSTDAPTPKTRSLAVYLSRSSSWNGNTRTVYASHTDSSETNWIAKIDVDASARYTAGQNSVSVSKGSWSGGICTLSPSAGTGASKTVQLCTATTWSGSTATVTIWDGTAADAQHGVNTGYSTTVTFSSPTSSDINITNSTWYDSTAQVPTPDATLTNTGNLITKNKRGYVYFRASINGVSGYKLYRIPINTY